ncbi:MAG: hypothetical protein ABL930_03980, partial [Pseudobdellovibrio sp.]
MKLIILMVLLATSLAKAEPMYQKTEPEISKLINAQDFSRLEINYGSTAGLKLFALYTPPIEYISRPKLKLAGIQLNPKNYSTLTTAVVSKLLYFDITTKKEKEIKFSKDGYIRGRSWSFDDKHFAVSVETPDCHEAWVVESSTLKKTKIPVCLNTVGGIGIFWVDNDTLGVSHRTAQQKNGYEAQVKVPT